MNFSNMTIPAKLRLGFVAVMLISLVVSTMVYVNARSIDKASFANVRSNKLNAEAREAMQDLATARAELATFVLSRSPAARTRFDAATAAFESKMEDFGKTTTVALQRERAEKLQALVRDYRGAGDALLALAANPSRQGEAIARIDGVNDTSAIQAVGDALMKTAQERVEIRNAEQRAAYDLTVTLLIIGGVLGVVAAMAMAWVMSRQIARPVTGITAAMRRLAEGDNQVQIDGATRKDEIGAMAGALLVFREQALAKAEAERAKAIADAEQTRLVDALSDGLGRLSGGDLTAHVDGHFSAGYAVVKTNFNAALDSLRDLIGSVSQSSMQIRTGSIEIAQASEDLARRTESNAASLEETSAALAQIDGRVRASADAATQTAHRADGAIATVSTGRQVADEAVTAMGRVSESAKGIVSVIESLDKIAFQTRVLAMNAAVEAGRAGDAGRGFAVVADLVSALAMRSEEEASSAREQLTVTQTDVGAAVEAVRKVDAALSQISGDVGQVHELVEGMARDNKAQSAAITEITAAMGTMDQATQQNAAMVEQTSAAARNLSTEVDALAERAAQFKVSGGPASYRPAPGAARLSLDTPDAVTLQRLSAEAAR